MLMPEEEKKYINQIPVFVSYAAAKPLQDESAACDILSLLFLLDIENEPDALPWI